MLNFFPISLIILRFFLGFYIVFIAINNTPFFGIITTFCLIIGLISDIFDGIIARQLNISTQFLRRLDSSVDVIFFSCVTIATYIKYPTFFTDNATMLFILIGFEIATYLVCYLKFKKEIATHSIGAKIWTLFIIATLIEVLLTHNSITIFYFCFWIGILTRIEIIGIIIVLKEWTNDVPSIYHAFQLRQNINIHRNKLFNG